MKTVLYMAVTINGLIAKEDDNTDFTTQIEWGSFFAKIKECRNVIMGHRTYEIMKAAGNLEELKDIEIVVISHEKGIPNADLADSLQSALTILKGKGYEQALVAGGGMTNGEFMQARLIDEIFIDVEPFAMGKGIKLFGDADFEAKLELLGTKMLSPNEIQLHYKVIR